jgi:hypothetical protein
LELQLNVFKKINAHILKFLEARVASFNPLSAGCGWWVGGWMDGWLEVEAFYWTAMRSLKMSAIVRLIFGLQIDAC